jgi:hypothetical protein
MEEVLLAVGHAKMVVEVGELGVEGQGPNAGDEGYHWDL